MRFDVISIFPQIFSAISDYGITSRALASQIYQLETWNPRDFTTDKRRTVDDKAYGGGPGMVMMAEPLITTLSAAKQSAHTALGKASPVIYLSPQGIPFTHDVVKDLLRFSGIILLCGRYEAVDQRVIDHHVDLEISLGDFVLSGGETAALCIIDALVRQLPGAINNPQAALEDSFSADIFDSPHYTRPEMLEQQSVPKVLLDGNHAHIAQWRRQQALTNTLKKRPDLIAKARANGRLTAADESFLRTLGAKAP